MNLVLLDQSNNVPSYFGSWAQIEKASRLLAFSSIPSLDMVKHLASHFKTLPTGNRSEVSVKVLSLALQERGIPPVLRGFYPTEWVLCRSRITRQLLVMADLFWLCGQGLSLHKDTAVLPLLLLAKKYDAALVAVNRATHWLEKVVASKASKRKRDLLEKIEPYRCQLVVVPYLLAGTGSFSPESIGQLIDTGAKAADALNSGGQRREFDMSLLYQVLYAAGCFALEGKGYAKAARYYNELILAPEKQISSSYIRKIHGRMEKEMPKSLVKLPRPRLKGRNVRM